MEKRYVRKGGEWHLGNRVRVSPIHGEDGVPHFLLTIAEDITERKHADMRKCENPVPPFVEEQHETSSDKHLH